MHRCWLQDGSETVATGQVTWERLKTYDLSVEFGEGRFQVHIDLMDPGKRPAVVWRPGETESIAGFELENEGSFNMRGWITTASGRQLAMRATHDLGLEYAVYVPNNPALVVVSASSRSIFIRNAGHMFMAPEESPDAELPALVALAYALACEQLLRLHWDSPRLTYQL